MTPTTLSRRAALQYLGLGAGVVVVSGAGVLTWRGVDGGVFSSGTGPAYDAWNAAGADGEPLSLVRAAVLAANNHNTQPWIFTVADEGIELYADLGRTNGSMDPALRELHISLGCAVENLVQAGPPNGLGVAVTLLPDAADPTHVASMALAPTRASSSALFDAIPSRRTNRYAYEDTPVAAHQLAALGDLVDVPDTQLVWLTTDAQKLAFSDLTMRATRAIIDDPEQSADDFRWYRSQWDDIQQHQDGITIDSAGQARVIRAISKLVPITQEQSNDGWLSSTRDTHLPTAAAFGALVVTEPSDPRQCLQVGRIWQRLHLSVTDLGLAVQPLCQIPERVDREATAGLPPSLTAELATMLPTDTHAVMTFRIGHPTSDVPKSPRRPAEDVVRTSGVTR